MSHVEVIREGRVLQAFNRLLKSDHVPFARNVFSNGTFSASSRSCSSKRLGLLLSKRYSGFGEESIRSWALRKTGLALPASTR